MLRLFSMQGVWFVGLKFEQSFPLALLCLLIKFWWQGSFLSCTSFWFKSHFLFCCKLFILICCMQLPTRILRQIPGRMIRLIQQWVACFDVGLIFLIIFVTDPLHCAGRYLLVVWRRMSLMTFWDKCLASLVNWFMWKFQQANVVDLFNLQIGKEPDDFQICSGSYFPYLIMLMLNGCFFLKS